MTSQISKASHVASSEHAAILQTMFDQSSAMINFISADGRILLVNRAWELTLGWTLDEVRDGGVDVLRECYPEADAYERVRRFLGEAAGEWADFRTRLRDGRMLDTAWCVLRLPDDAALGVGVDVSSRPRSTDAFLASHEQMRSLAAYLEALRESDRTRIARELHDDLGQALTGLRFDLSWLRTKLGNAKPDVVDRVRRMTAGVDETLRTVRRIASDLRPGILDDLGLTAALQWHADEFQARTGIRCRVTFRDGLPTLGGALATAVFRIVQEALTNVARHAGATRVEVSLRYHAGALALEIADDGRGITDGERLGSGSFGLLGMRERAYLHGGDLTVAGEPGRGTTVVARLRAGTGIQ